MTWKWNRAHVMTLTWLFTRHNIEENIIMQLIDSLSKPVVNTKDQC